MASSSNTKMIRLISSDGVEFVVSEKMALQSGIIRILIQDAAATEETIRLPNMSSKILAKVIENAADASSTEMTGEGRSIKMSDNKLEKQEQDISDIVQDISKLCIAKTEKDDIMMKGRTIRLKSSDGKEFTVSETVARHSLTIRLKIAKGGDEETIRLPIESKFLAKVIEYCNAADASLKTEATDEGGSTKTSDNELEKWEQDVLDVDQNTLYGIIFAAYYLENSKLRNAAQKKMDMMEGKSPQKK